MAWPVVEKVPLTTRRTPLWRTAVLVIVRSPSTKTTPDPASVTLSPDPSARLPLMYFGPVRVRVPLTALGLMTPPVWAAPVHVVRQPLVVAESGKGYRGAFVSTPIVADPEALPIARGLPSTTLVPPIRMFPLEMTSARPSPVGAVRMFAVPPMATSPLARIAAVPRLSQI